jgi:hypothetical protein
VGTELYYQQPLQFMFLILVALAWRTEPRRPAPRPLAAVVSRLRTPVVAAGLLVAVAAAYGALYVTSVHAMADRLRGTVWDPRRSESYVRTFRASAASTIRRTGRAPVLFNAQVPDEVVGKWDSYAVFFPMIDGRVRFSTVTSPMYAVQPSGALVRVTFHARVGGLLARAVVLEPGASPVRAVLRAGAACTPPASGTVRLRIPLARPAHLRWSYAMQVGRRLPDALRLFLLMPREATVAVAPLGRRPERIDFVFPPTFGRGASGQYVPLDRHVHARAIDLTVPAGTCVSSLTVGSFARP